MVFPKPYGGMNTGWRGAMRSLSMLAVSALAGNLLLVSFVSAGPFSGRPPAVEINLDVLSRFRGVAAPAQPMAPEPSFSSPAMLPPPQVSAAPLQSLSPPPDLPPPPPVLEGGASAAPMPLELLPHMAAPPPLYSDLPPPPIAAPQEPQPLAQPAPAYMPDQLAAQPSYAPPLPMGEAAPSQPVAVQPLDRAAPDIMFPPRYARDQVVRHEATPIELPPPPAPVMRASSPSRGYHRSGSEASMPPQPFIPGLPKLPAKAEPPKPDPTPRQEEPKAEKAPLKKAPEAEKPSKPLAEDPLPPAIQDDLPPLKEAPDVLVDLPKPSEPVKETPPAVKEKPATTGSIDEEFEKSFGKKKEASIALPGEMSSDGAKAEASSGKKHSSDLPSPVEKKPAKEDLDSLLGDVPEGIAPPTKSVKTKDALPEATLPPLDFKSDAKAPSAETSAKPEETGKKTADIDLPELPALPDVKAKAPSADSAPSAASAPAGVADMVLTYSTTEVDVPLAAEVDLKDVAGVLKEQKEKRVHIVAYAGASEGQEGAARRTSLDRAIAIRGFLLKEGIETSRITTQAMGNTATSGDAERVDIFYQ